MQDDTSSGVDREAPTVSSVVRLREVEESDLEIFFAHQSDPVAARMAAFASRGRDAFTAHWLRILADDTKVAMTISRGGAVAGNVVCWEDTASGKRLVGYWIGREHWGHGVASAGLAELVRLVRARPLYAQVAVENAASIRVLEKCGFVHTGVREVGEDGIEELEYVLA